MWQNLFYCILNLEKRNTFQHFHSIETYSEAKFICVHRIYAKHFGVKMFTCVHIKVTINHYIGADAANCAVLPVTQTSSNILQYSVFPSNPY